MKHFIYFIISTFAHFQFTLQLENPTKLIPNGSQQIFDFVNQVSMGDLQHSFDDKGASYRFTSKLRINSVWGSTKDQLLQVHITEPMVSAASRSKTERSITTIPDRPFYISLIGGRPHKVIAHTSRDQSLLNLERGVASLLQLQYENGPVHELDVSGQCKVFYDIKSTTRIDKTKTDCSHWDLRVHYRAEKPLGVSQYSREHIQFELAADGSLNKVEASETHRVWLTAKTDAGSRVESHLALKHLAMGDEVIEQLNYASLDEAVASLLDWYRIFDIEADVDGALSEIKHTTLLEEIKRSVEQLTPDHIGSEVLSLAIAHLLPLARIANQAECVEILRSFPSLHATLVDLLGAAQTKDAYNAVFEVFPLAEEKNTAVLEKYLQALALGTHPERYIIEDLLFEQLLNKEHSILNKRLHDTAIQTVAAMAKHSGLESNDSLLAELRNFILTQLDSKCGKDTDCKTLYVRALENLQDASTIPTLLSHALAGNTNVAVGAMQALKSFPIVNFHEEHRQAFTQIFYQNKRKYDSSVRTMALDILLMMKPTKDQLNDLLHYLTSTDPHFEVKTYVLQKLKLLSEKCPRFQILLRDCLAERPRINNYNVVAQKGLSTALLRQLSQYPAFNESLESVQEIYKGVLKRGSVELLLAANSEELSTFKLTLYTSGLFSFVGDSNNEVDEDDVDDSPVTAGMEITVNGVLLRPLVFFTGQSELMGHVWSGTASDLTPAYQAISLAQDHEHYIVMSSGVSVYMRVVGVRSVDLSGKVELSIWNRNAQTEIHQKTGSAVVGVMVAGFTYARLENTLVLTTAPNLSLQADIDFYSDMKLCMQLQRPEALQTLINVKKVKLNAGSRYTKRFTKRQTHKSAGRTLALNQKNNQMCNAIFVQ